MKKIVVFALALAFAFSLCVSPASAKTTIRVAYENNPGEPLDVLANKWKELAKERSNGEIELLLYPSSQLGSKKDVLEQAKMGVNVITITDAGFLADFVPDFGVLVGPYLTDKPEDIFKIFKTDWYKSLDKQLRDKGLFIVTPEILYGIRHMVTNKPVHTPDDLHGMKIRSANNRIMIATLEAMGATPTPMPLSEVYSSLTQGVIDGAENPLSVLWGQKLNEPAPFVELIGYVTMTAFWVGGESFFSNVPADTLKILQETGDEIGLLSQKMVLEEDAKIIDKMKAAGAEVIKVDTAPFREKSKKVYGMFPEWTPGLYEHVQELLAK